jgi:putative ABC transport system ATP-binding protein
MPIVKCHRLSRLYRQGKIEVHAVDGIDLEIARGAFVALAGPSGSGKTTLLNLIGGLDRPTSGHVQIDDQRLDALGDAATTRLRLHHIGFVFQSFNLIPVLTARENVEYVMLLQGVRSGERRTRALAILEEVGLGELHARRPAELSGGQQQRVAVARAIVSSPKVVLADEPTANLDSHSAEELLALMERINVERGVTFVFSTHDPRVMDRAHRIIRLQDGRIIDDEPHTN